MKNNAFRWTPVLLVLLALALIPAVASAAGGNGLTWVKSTHDSTFGVDRMSCAGCDPYVGDTSCKTALPVACIKQDGSPNPGVLTDYYNGWTKGHVALTRPVRGDKLHSLKDANYVCYLHFGDGYRMAKHSDGGGGWNWWAFGNVDEVSRAWMHISNQPGNCWD